MNMRPCHVSRVFFLSPGSSGLKQSPWRGSWSLRGGVGTVSMTACSAQMEFPVTRPPVALGLLPASQGHAPCPPAGAAAGSHMLSRGVRAFKMGKAASGSDGYWPYWTPYKTWDFPSKYCASAWPGLTPGLFMPVLSSEELDLEWWREVALLEEQVTFLDDRLVSANCHDKGLRIKSTKPKSLNCKKSS